MPDARPGGDGDTFSSGEDRGGKTEQKKGKGDPLDGVNGTEDW